MKDSMYEVLLPVDVLQQKKLPRQNMTLYVDNAWRHTQVASMEGAFETTRTRTTGSRVPSMAAMVCICWSRTGSTTTGTVYQSACIHKCSIYSMYSTVLDKWCRYGDTCMYGYMP